MMSGCLDNVRCDFGFDWSEKRNSIASVIAGLLFFSGWWIILDVAAVYHDDKDFKNAYYTCGVISTLSMFIINSVSNSQVRGDSMTSGILGSKGARIWLLFGFLLGFGALISAAWIMFGEYVVKTYPEEETRPATWPGVALFIQNALIFFGSLIYKFGRTEDLWG